MGTLADTCEVVIFAYWLLGLSLVCCCVKPERRKDKRWTTEGLPSPTVILSGRISSFISYRSGESHNLKPQPQTTDHNYISRRRSSFSCSRVYVSDLCSLASLGLPSLPDHLVSGLSLLNYSHIPSHPGLTCLARTVHPVLLASHVARIPESAVLTIGHDSSFPLI